jgi:hypothetical protein
MGRIKSGGRIKNEKSLFRLFPIICLITAMTPLMAMRIKFSITMYHQAERKYQMLEITV